MIGESSLRACLSDDWVLPEHDLTGITGPAENEKGLDDARRWLTR